jgi:hypothetical protein
MAKTIATNKPGLKPAAWIVSPNDKGRKSIKNDKVFLNDGDEFEIEIFNPLGVSVLADIKLNSQSISKTGLVVKPGQRIYLDCFIDDKSKFIFKTYEIDGSEESLEATEKNGLLEVFFYKEEVLSLNNWRDKFQKVIVERWGPVYYPVYYPTYPTYPRTHEIWYTNPNFFTTGGSYTIGDNIGGTLTNVSTNTVNGFNSGTNLYSTSINMTNGTINTSIETGRIEKGEKSKQEFTEVDLDFEKNYIASTIIQILPESRKPIDSSEINKVKGSFTSVMAKDILKRESDGIIELIKKLSELHKEGVLTDEEFSSKKAELLKKI